MSMTDAIGRVAEIRSTLQQLSAAPSAASSAAASSAAASVVASAAAAGSLPAASTAGSGGTDFASTLAALTGTSAATTPAAGTSTAAALTETAASGSGTATSGKVLDAVQKYLGLPYVWGGNDPAVGLDCSSFVQNVFKDLGYSLPRVTWDQMNSGTEVASMAQAQAGDLMISHDGGHVAIYLGNGKAVDAPQPGQTIQIRDAWETDANVTTIRRILPAETAGSAASASVTDLVAAARAAQASLTGASL